VYLVGIIGSLVLYTDILWLSVAMVGFTVAIYYPSGISYASQFTKMSGRYIGVFAIGCTRFFWYAIFFSNNFINFSGQMISPLVNSILMESDYNIFKTTIIIMQGVFLLAFIGTYFIGRRLPESPTERLDYKEGDVKP